MSREKVCMSYCNGICGMDFDDSTMDEDGIADDMPSSMQDGHSCICMDDGYERGGCDEWYWDENDPTYDDEEDDGELA